jgi:hypothetical protein
MLIALGSAPVAADPQLNHRGNQGLWSEMLCGRLQLAYQQDVTECYWDLLQRSHILVLSQFVFLWFLASYLLASYSTILEEKVKGPSHLTLFSNVFWERVLGIKERWIEKEPLSETQSPIVVKKAVNQSLTLLGESLVSFPPLWPPSNILLGTALQEPTEEGALPRPWVAGALILSLRTLMFLLACQTQYKGRVH